MKGIIMKRSLFLSVLFGALPLLSMAQDDMYFTPSKSNQESSKETVKEAPSYYSGIKKTNDAYNRRGVFQSSYQVIGKDSLGNDIIEYKSLSGTTRRDTVYGGLQRKYEEGDDFAYSRRMSRFDDFYGYYDPWFASSFYYGDPFFYDRWRWRSSFYYGGWYDPWYYSSFYGGYPYYYYGSPYYYAGIGWGYPWYYGWSGYYRPYRNVYYSYNGHTGTANHWGRRADNTYPSNSSRVFGTRRQRTTQTYPNRSMQDYRDRFEGSRSIEAPTRTYSQPNSGFGNTSRGSFGGGSFGGSRGSFGTGGAGGGGSFRGRR